MCVIRSYNFDIDCAYGCIFKMVSAKTFEFNVRVG